MISVVRLLPLLLLLPVMSRAQAPPPPPFGVGQLMTDDVQIIQTISIPNLSANEQPISGTKVEVDMTLSSKVHTAGQYGSIEMRKAELVFHHAGTEPPPPPPILLWQKVAGPPNGGGDGPMGGANEGAPGGGGGGTDPGGDVPGFVPVAQPEPHFHKRFASTRFKDGTALSIKFRVVWWLIRGDSKDEVTIEAEVMPMVHNKVLAWKFTRFQDGTQLTEPWLSIRDAVMTFGTSAYMVANYSEEVLTLGTHLINKNQINDHPGKVTSLFADTHGTANGAQDSGISPGSAGQNAYWAEWDNVPRPMWKTTVHPLGLAIAAIYGCATLPSQQIVKLPWRKENGATVNSVYAGFTMTIYGRYWQTPNDPSTAIIYDIDEHAEAFFNALAAGKTAEAARLAANLTVTDNFPLNYNWPKPVMTLYGDPLMTLTDVYLDVDERSILGLGPSQASGHWYFPWTTP